MPVVKKIIAAHFKLDPGINIALAPRHTAQGFAVGKPVGVHTLDEKVGFELS
jgi:hypothetical protein